MIHLDLFSGIGGFSLAAKSVWGGSWRSAGFCDNEPFSQAIIKKHFPKAKIYGDIKNLKGSDTGPVDLVTGGFPCQPFSSAGNRGGTEDDRYLWPEMLRVIRETSPRWIVGENVGGLITWNGGMVLERVLSDLEAEGYEAWPLVIPACAVGAPHRRDRVWIIAHADRRSNRRVPGKNARARGEERLRQRHQVGKPCEPDSIRVPAYAKGGRRIQGYTFPGGISARKGAMGKAKRGGSSDGGRFQEWNNWPAAAARLCSMDDGLSGGLARPRGWRNAALKGAGNAIVPQVVAEIFRFIKLIDESK